MKKLVLAVVLVALLAAAAFGGQAIASNKPADVTVSEEASEILFDWGGSYWGSPVRIQSFEGYFDASDSPNAYVGNILEESYPEIRHVSVTIGASSFDDGGNNDYAYVLVPIGESPSSTHIVNNSEKWANPSYNYETIEFNADNWSIYMNIPEGSIAYYEYAVTVTYPR